MIVGEEELLVERAVKSVLSGLAVRQARPSKARGLMFTMRALPTWRPVNLAC